VDCAKCLPRSRLKDALHDAQDRIDQYAVLLGEPAGVGDFAAAGGRPQEGIECDLFYFNLRFATRTGLKDFSQIAYGIIEESLAGEWSFATKWRSGRLK